MFHVKPDGRFHVELPGGGARHGAPRPRNLCGKRAGPPEHGEQAVAPTGPRDVGAKHRQAVGWPATAIRYRWLGNDQATARLKERQSTFRRHRGRGERASRDDVEFLPQAGVPGGYLGATVDDLDTSRPAKPRYRIREQ